MPSANNTPIARWRARMQWSQRMASEQLGVALTTYQDQERGTSRATGEPIRTPGIWLLACAALEADIDPIK